MESELEKAPRTIGQMFDDIAPSYDLLNHMLSLTIDVRWRKRALRGLQLCSKDVVLDVASGTGDMALLAISLHGCSVVGLDLSRNMLGNAARKCNRNGTFYSAIGGNALSMPFQDASFDKAMVSFGIRNMTDMPSFFREIGRVLRPGGSLAVLEFSLPTYPLVRQLYLVYLTKVLPFIGGLQSGNRSAYQYLSGSICQFPSPQSIATLVEQHGLELLESIPLTMGIAHLFIVRKKS
jgi:demethylmenaquinone methyltransferase/2-methoxy-6-polyprenyl-1,4-benzoquinol methylase